MSTCHYLFVTNVASDNQICETGYLELAMLCLLDYQRNSKRASQC